MSREKIRLGIVLLALLAQAVGGVAGFLLAPEAIFADIGSDPLARLCLRLAAYTNAATVVMLAGVLWHTRSPGVLRWLAGGGLVYHALAGADAAIALSTSSVALAEPAAGPAAFHATMATLLLAAVLLPSSTGH